MTYYTGFLLAVPSDKKDAYTAMAKESWPLFQEFGALEQVETWGVDVPDGKTTSFPMAVKLEPGEVVVFSWLKWPDRATADAGSQKMMEDPRMAAFEMPFDGKRMMWGGFEPIFHS